MSATVAPELPLSPAGISLDLRAYQRSALDAITAAALRGVQRQVVSLPTGAGKTIIFAHLLVERQTRTLILVHRDELVHQTLDKLAMVARGAVLDIGVVKAERDEHAAEVVVASVQTLQRERRLQRLSQTFGLVIVDECHHALVENSYGRILEYAGSFHAAGPLTVGYTATPYRPNNDPIITTPAAPGCFEEVVYTIPLPSLINDGYLSPIQAKGIFIDFDLDKVHTTHGDYNAEELADAIMAADGPQHLARGYQELAEGRRALIFCPTVAMVEAVTTTFLHAGLKAAMVTATTPTLERQAIYRDIRAGRLQALVNCMVLTEGFDEPSIDCVMLARPTKSKVLFYQCIGRGLRLWPTKTDCLLIDAVGATKRHGLLSIAAELGLLLPKPDLDAPLFEPEAQEREEGEGEGEEKPTGYQAHDIDLLRRPPLHWVETSKGYWVVSLADQMVRVRTNGQGTYQLEVRKGQERVYACLADRLSQELCFGIASDTASQAQLMHLVKQGARWREKARSPKQEAFAQKLGVRIDPRWCSGELSDAITAVIGNWYDEQQPQKGIAV